MIRPSSETPVAKLGASPAISWWQGAIGALLCWFLWRDLGILDLFPLWRGSFLTFFAIGILGAVLGRTRGRAVIFVSLLLSLTLWLVVAFTPLTSWCVRSLRIEQALRKADAVVVLLASIQRDNDFGNPSLERTLHGIELIRQGYASHLVLTQGVPPQGSHRVAASTLMRNLRIRCDFEMVGPVRDTHDEAVAVSRLARDKGWKRILLVTSPVHSQRAKLVFAKTGLEVIATPCREAAYDWENLQSPGDRIEAFNAALHEIVGLRAYRARGWI